MRGIGLFVLVVSYCASVCVIAYGSKAALWYVCAVITVCSTIAYVGGVHARQKILGSVAIAAVGVLLALARMELVPREIPVAFRDDIGSKVTLEGTVVELPDQRETGERLTIEVSRGTERTRIIASVPLFPSIYVGDELNLSGKLSKPAPFETDGGRTFPYDRFLEKDGVYAVLQPAHATVVGHSPRLWLRLLRLLERTRDEFLKLLNSILPEPESSLASGLVLGGEQGLGPKLIEQFTVSGMLQIIVLSVYNVMIVANVVLAALRRVPKNAAILTAILFIALFILLAGAGSSAMRAGFMAALAVLGRAYRRRYDVLRALAASVLVLSLANPLMLAYDPGFQFSCIATFGLVIGVPIIAPRLMWLNNAFLIEAFSTTLAAEISLLPYLLWQTGNLSFVSVIANVLAMPAVPVAMAASAIGACAAVPLQAIEPLLLPALGLPAFLPLTYIIRIATLFASLPWAMTIIPLFSFWLVVVAYALLTALVIRLSRPLRQESVALPRSS
jgi:competence protein ComEC